MGSRPVHNLAISTHTGELHISCANYQCVNDPCTTMSQLANLPQESRSAAIYHAHAPPHAYLVAFRKNTEKTQVMDERTDLWANRMHGGGGLTSKQTAH